MSGRYFWLCMYTVTNIFYHLSIPLQLHSAVNRTVMPKLKYPFLMKSPFHNDVKMQALHVHVTTCTCCIFVCGLLYKPLCRTALSILTEGTSSNSPVESVNYMYPAACMCTAGLSNRVCPVVCLSLCLSTKKY